MAPWIRVVVSPSHGVGGGCLLRSCLYMWRERHLPATCMSVAFPLCVTPPADPRSPGASLSHSVWTRAQAGGTRTLPATRAYACVASRARHACACTRTRAQVLYRDEYDLLKLTHPELPGHMTSISSRRSYERLSPFLVRPKFFDGLSVDLTRAILRVLDHQVSCASLGTTGDSDVCLPLHAWLPPANSQRLVRTSDHDGRPMRLT